MAARARTAPKTAPRADLLEAPLKQIHDDFVAYLQEQTGYEVDPKTVHLCTVLRMDFQRSDLNQARLKAAQKAKEEREAAREERAAGRAEKRAAKAEEASEEKPAGRRPRAAKATPTPTAAKAAPAGAAVPRAAKATAKATPAKAAVPTPRRPRRTTTEEPF